MRLPLGPHKEDCFAFSGQISNELRRFLKHLQRLLQIDDVNSVALTEDVFLHLWVPALRLMPEVNTRFEQLLHGDVSQKTSFLVCILCSSRELGIAFPPPHLSSTGRMNCSQRRCLQRLVLERRNKLRLYRK